jgi:mannose-6-phosphate isomerase-like protein (cupin superfamily)
MPIVYHEDLPREPFPHGATYQTIVGDAEGSTPVRLGLQTSPHGYSTGTHWHPYVEILTVLEGEGEAWMEGEAQPVKLGPGMTLVLPAHVKHGFRVTGPTPLKTLGVHCSPHRVVERDG